MSAGELQAVLSVVVRSTNSVKVNAVASAFSSVFPNIRTYVRPVQVCSGVPKQPYGDIVTKCGAMTRALQAEAICSLERDEAANFFRRHRRRCH